MTKVVAVTVAEDTAVVKEADPTAAGDTVVARVEASTTPAVDSPRATASPPVVEEEEEDGRHCVCQPFPLSALLSRSPLSQRTTGQRPS